MSDEVGSLKPDGPMAIQLGFKPDGNAVMQLDCNRGTASWRAEPSANPTNGGLAFGQVATTRALCPGASLGEKLARDTQYIRGYFLKDGRLSLSLMADGGIYIFDPIPPSASVEEGGPRVWTVTGAPSGLNLRVDAATNADVVSYFSNGDQLDNLGCQRAVGRLWCYVHQFGGGPVGYVAADFLMPALGPNGSMPAGPDDSALRAGQGDFDATGRVRCTVDGMTGECEMGVARAGGGFATVTISKPDGRQRLLYFRMGKVAGANTSQADGYPRIVSDRRGDTFLIGVGSERYKVPDAVIFGG